MCPYSMNIIKYIENETVMQWFLYKMSGHTFFRGVAQGVSARPEGWRPAVFNA